MNIDPGPEGLPPSFRERERKLRDTNQRGSVDPGSENQ